jgi:hypothetical protein
MLVVAAVEFRFQKDPQVLLKVSQITLKLSVKAAAFPFTVVVHQTYCWLTAAPTTRSC